jgi:hypothetical protein
MLTSENQYPSFHAAAPQPWQVAVLTPKTCPTFCVLMDTRIALLQGLITHYQSPLTYTIKCGNSQETDSVSDIL